MIPKVLPIPAFLIHYGWRGTVRFRAVVLNLSAFLIHYGWRGTLHARRCTNWSNKFLIHYGWRGTPTTACTCFKLTRF